MYPDFAAARDATLLTEPVERLARDHPGIWRLDACGVTRMGRATPVLVHSQAYDLTSDRVRVVVIGGLSGGAGDVELVVRVLDSFVAEKTEVRDRIALTAIPCANRDGLAMGVGPDNGAGGNPTTGYPPDGEFFDHPSDPETRYLWRWVCFQAPDVVVELRDGDSPYWEANGAATDLARALIPAQLVPAGSLLHALADGVPSGLGQIPGLRLSSAPRSGAEAAAALWRALASMPAPARSPAGAALGHRRARHALDVARLLAGVYGQRLDPVVYTQGVGISGRLRLHQLLRDHEPEVAGELSRGAGDPTEPRDAGLRTAGLRSEASDAVEDVTRLVGPLVDGGRVPFADRAGGQELAGVVWAEELHRLSGDRRYLELLVTAADRYSTGKDGKPPPPADPDFRTEDMFFTAAVLGRAYRVTGDARYVDILAPYMQAAGGQQQPNGLFWHCESAPYFWGRGNGFAAMGFAEALTYLPEDHRVRPTLLDSHRRHLEAIAGTRAPSGMLRQVLDFPGSYEELSATCMTGYAIARGIRLGWLEEATFRPLLDGLWTAALDRIDEEGGLVDVCTGTGVQRDLRAYLDRPAVSGYDDRGGSLALWFAVEMAACILSPSRGKRSFQT